LLGGVAGTLVALDLAVFVAQSYAELTLLAGVIVFPLPAAAVVGGVRTLYGSRLGAAVGAGAAGVIGFVGLRQALYSDMDAVVIVLLLSALPGALLAATAACRTSSAGASVSDDRRTSRH
jgi:uncharacterized integral membrane protein